VDVGGLMVIGGYYWPVLMAIGSGSLFLMIIDRSVRLLSVIGVL